MGILVILGIILLVAAAVFLDAFILKLVANWVLGLFGIGFSLTFWQAFGICVLLSLIGSFFKSSRGGD